MRVLVTFGSRRGGADGIARAIAATLESSGHEASVVHASSVETVRGFDGVIVGDDLYVDRWHGAAQHFVHQHRRELCALPVWFFSCAPLDDSADHEAIEPPRAVRTLMESIGAQSHALFAGSFPSGSRGVIASSTTTATPHHPELIRDWTAHIAETLPSAHPRAPVEVSGDSVWRVAVHGMTGWLALAVIWALAIASGVPLLALWLRAALAPVVFGIAAVNYFRQPAARSPGVVAIAFTLICAFLDLVIGGERTWLYAGNIGAWLAYPLILLAVWGVGELSELGMIRLPSSPSSVR